MKKLRMHRVLLVAISSALIWSCASAPKLSKPIVVDPTFTLYGSSRITKLQVAIKVAENDGHVMLCSAIAAQEFRVSALRYLEDWREGASISVNGDTISGGLSQATLYDGDARVRGKLAGCSVTDDKWQAAYASAPVVLRYDDWTPSGGRKQVSYWEGGLAIVYGLLSLATIPFCPECATN